MPDLSLLAVLDWPSLLLAFVVVVVAAAAQAALGVGFGIVAAPVLAVIDPELVPGTVMVLGTLTALFVAVRERAAFQFANVGYALAGRVLFSLLGALTASLLSPQSFLLVFAALILAAVGLSLSGLRVEPTRRNLFLAGSASGFMGTLTAVGTPPLAIVYQYAPGAEVRANLSAFFAVGGFISILSLAGFGALRPRTISRSACSSCRRCCSAICCRRCSRATPTAAGCARRCWRSASAPPRSCW